MKSVEEEFPFVQYFSNSYEKSYIITELLILSKIFQNCGKGCLINKDKIYFYKTYIPNMENMINKTKRKILLLFYCESSYKQKYIDEFTNNIFDLLGKDAFEENKLKNNISNTIDDLFDIYQNVKNKEEIYYEYVKNIMKNIDSNNNDSNNSSMESCLSLRKRIDSEFFKKRDEKSLMSIRGLNNSDLMENIEMVKITESDSDLTVMFKANKFNYYSMKMKKLKKIKIINIIIFSVIGLAMYILIPFSISK
jgi:hypothetical protein